MKKQITKILAIMFAIVLCVGNTCFAHSGRTDASGGHRDNKNKSGLGSYHYHCGGYPAHLHPNGICPYTSSSSASKSRTTSSSSSSSTTRTVAAQPPRKCIVGTNYKTYINDCEVPTFAHCDGGAYIIAEDLANYGFDISWNNATQTVSVKRNDVKQLTPMDMSHYCNIHAGQKVFDINEANTVKVALEGNGYTYYPQAYNCNGYTAISVDELKMFGNWNWWNDTGCVTLKTR